MGSKSNLQYLIILYIYFIVIIFCCKSCNSMPINEDDDYVTDVDDQLEIGGTRVGIIDKTKRWFNGVVPYYIVTTGSTPTFTESVKTAIKALESATTNCIKFIEVTEEEAKLTYHVLITMAEKKCQSSFAGMGIGIKKFTDQGYQDVIVHPKACNKNFAGSIVHELIHVLGFRHEHTRFDRDKYVFINTTGLDESGTHQYVVSDPRDWEYNGVNYNYESIMHYGPSKYLSARLTPLKNSPEPLGDYKMIGQRTTISGGDADMIKNLYKDICNQPQAQEQDGSMEPSKDFTIPGTNPNVPLKQAPKEH